MEVPVAAEFRSELLDDDVLLSIFSYLHGEDALNTALVSRKFYELAIPRVAAEAYCSYPAVVARLCDYMLSPLGVLPRARYLQALVLMPDAFARNPGGLETTSLTPLDETLQLGGLLIQTHGLRTLRWGADFRSHCARDPRLHQAFGTWSNLAVLRLCGVDNSIISLLQSVVTLQVLTLEEYISEVTGPDTEQTADYDGFQTLLKTLTHLRQLRTLSLYRLQSGDSTTQTTTDSAPAPPTASLASIVDLSLEACSANYFLLVPLCPRLSRLTIKYLGEPLAHSALPRGLPLPPLKSLAIPIRDLDVLDVDRLSTTQTLRCVTPFERPTRPVKLALALPALSPVSMSVNAYLATGANPSWDVLASQQPGVRMLDVVPLPAVVWSWRDAGWQHYLPKVLARIPLASLRLVVHSDAQPEDPRGSGRPAEAGPAMAPPADSMPLQMTYPWTDVLSAIQTELFEALPTLRLLAVASERALPAQTDPRQYMNGLSEGPAAHGGYPGGWDTLDRQRFRFHWWCRTAHGGEPVSVTEEEGQRVYGGIMRICVSPEGKANPTLYIDKLFEPKSQR